MSKNIPTSQEKVLDHEVTVRRVALKGQLLMLHIFGYEDTLDAIVGVSGSALKVWLYLMLNYCSRSVDGEIYLLGYGTREVCITLGCSRQSMSKWMKELVGAGLLKKIRQGVYYCERRHGVTLHITEKLVHKKESPVPATWEDFDESDLAIAITVEEGYISAEDCDKITKTFWPILKRKLTINTRLKTPDDYAQ